MKRLLLPTILIFFSFQSYSQNIGINANGATPNAAAMLDIDVSALTTKTGLLIPRVTAAQKTSMNPLPAAAQGLVVYQTDGVEGFYYNTSTTTTPSWSYLSPSTAGWSTTGNTGTTAGANFIGTTDATDWVIKTNNTERLRVLSGGNVGIGTITPANKLDIEGGLGVGATYSGTNTAPSNGAIIQGNVGIGTSSPTGKFQTVVSSGRYTVPNWGVNSNTTILGEYKGDSTNAPQLRFSWGTNGNFMDIGENSAGDFVVEGNDINRLTVLNTGNVGIGTTAPDRPLTVQGTGGNNELISLKNSAGTTKYHWNLSGGGLNLAESGVADGRIYIKDATGNVGIGTTTPVELLEVGKNGSDNYIRVDAGSSNANSTGLKLYEFGFNFGWNLRFDANDDDLYFEHNNSGTITNIMKLDNWGNIGIGTTAPVNKLDVEGALAVGATYSGTTTAPTNGAIIEGNVGIGTTAPDRPLTVQGTGVNNELISLKNSAGTSKYHWNLSGSGLNLAESGVADGRIYVKDATGNVGIGTTAPAQKLDVAGKIQMQTGAAVGYVPVSDANGTMTWTNPTSLTITETDPQVSSTTTNYIPKWNGTSLVDGMAYDNGTGIGIGTTAPATALHIDNSANSGPQITLSAPSGGTPGIVFRPFQTPAQWTNPAQAFISATDNNYSADIHFLTKTPGAIANALTERVTILNNGNLGVGIAAPTSTLHINGAFATTVKTVQAAGTNNPDNTAAVWFYSSGTGTITLPAASTCSGRRYVIVNQTGAARTTSTFIDLTTTSVTSLANNTSIEVISDGTSWRQIK